MAIARSDNWVRRFEVTDPRKHKNGFTIYKVTSVVFPRSAPEAFTKVTVWKRYNDFKKLYKSLKSYHKQLKISENFPQLCKGKFFKRFEESIIKDRICFALELLNFVGRYQSLFTSEPFLHFFNSGYQVTEDFDGTWGINENGNNLESNDATPERNLLDAEVWDSKSSSESTSVVFDGSDEGSFQVVCTPDSLSPAHSTTEMLSTKEEIGLTNSSVEPDAFSAESCTADKLTDSLFTRENNHPCDTLILQKSRDTESWQRSSDIVGDHEDYLVQAAYRIGQAQKLEIEGKFEAAFSFYKAAVGCLLNAVQDEDDPVRRQAIAEKANQYLQRAENIYGLHKAVDSVVGPKKIADPVEELKLYKVLGVLDSVMLVVDTTDQKYYVIKVLQKSPCPLNSKKTIIPYNVPYMVKLHKYFENENSIFLVLQYARGGKLWDQLNYQFNSRRETQGSDSLSCSSNNCQLDVRVACKNGAEGCLDEEQDTCVNATNGCTDKKDEECETKQMMSPPVIKTFCPEEGQEPENEIEPTVIGDPEVLNLLENSQKLLNSVTKTLEISEKITSNVNMDLLDIETVFDLNCKLVNTKKSDRNSSGTKGRKKRSKSAALKSKLEKCYSSEDLTESRPRTASSSIDRRSEWSRLAADLPPRISESLVQNWAAEILVALETLHRYGVICRDLRPANILLDGSGNVLLTYQAHWTGVDSLVSEEAIAGFYAAPENLSIFPITPAVDWWSFGALLHELLTGKVRHVSLHEELRKRVVKRKKNVSFLVGEERHAEGSTECFSGESQLVSGF
ncbi:hypothetical protein RUM43_006892 [Polyplax serrata]|uniref:Ribosomal protein S6 kinase delta-1 n=1 Tax=Polyplax serrata TaxID=468196 RepID=A0AAN8S558_POLSC